MPFEQQFSDHLAALETTRALAPEILDAATHVIDCFAAGNKVLWAGNGGSAADSQHLAAELVGRFKQQREALASIALTTDTSILTAVANDYDFAQIFARQIRAIGQAGDVFFALSTSGNSANILEAVKAAEEKQVYTIALCGNDGGKLAAAANLSLTVPVTDTARIQEMHILIGHLICEHVENHVTGKP